MAKLALRHVDELNREIIRLQQVVGKLVANQGIVTQDTVFTVKEVRVLITEAIETLIEENPILDEL
jgi:hypothetical protein